jgi:hypothetical protein
MMCRYERLLKFSDSKARQEVWQESFALRAQPQRIDAEDNGDEHEPDELEY